MNGTEVVIYVIKTSFFRTIKMMKKSKFYILILILKVLIPLGWINFYRVLVSIVTPICFALWFHSTLLKYEHTYPQAKNLSVMT